MTQYSVEEHIKRWLFCDEKSGGAHIQGDAEWEKTLEVAEPIVTKAFVDAGRLDGSTVPMDVEGIDELMSTGVVPDWCIHVPHEDLVSFLNDIYSYCRRAKVDLHARV